VATYFLSFITGKPECKKFDLSWDPPNTLSYSVTENELIFEHTIENQLNRIEFKKSEIYTLLCNLPPFLIKSCCPKVEVSLVLNEIYYHSGKFNLSLKDTKIFIDNLTETALVDFTEKILKNTNWTIVKHLVLTHVFRL